MTTGPSQRRPYPKEKKRETTPKWKEDVLASLEDKEISIPQAAKILGVDRKTVWQTLKTDQQTSSIVGALTQLAEVDPPLVEQKQDALDRLISTYSPEDRERAEAILIAALGKRRPNN